MRGGRAVLGLAPRREWCDAEHLEIESPAGVLASALAPAHGRSRAAGSRSIPRSRAARSPRWSRPSTRAIPKVQVSLYRSGTTEVMNRLQAEFAAGRPQADVVLIADAVAMTQLKNDGRLLAYADAPGRQGAAGADRSRQDLLRHQADHHRHRLQHQARRRPRRVVERPAGAGSRVEDDHGASRSIPAPP